MCHVLLPTSSARRKIILGGGLADDDAIPREITRIAAELNMAKTGNTSIKKMI